jgi:7-cyano-7-deazaguanine synthase
MYFGFEAATQTSDDNLQIGGSRLVADKKAVVLLSGGLDSATTLAVVRSDGFQCYALTFAYGQRHKREIEAAKKVVESLGATEHLIINIDLAAFGGSA